MHFVYYFCKQYPIFSNRLDILVNHPKLQIFLKTSNCVHCVFKHIIINVTYTPQLIIILQIMGVFFKSSSIIVHRKIGHNIILMDRVNINLCSCRPFVTKKKKKSLLPPILLRSTTLYTVCTCVYYIHIYDMDICQCE